MYTRQLKLPRSQATVTDPSPHAHVTKSNFPKLILSTHKIYLFFANAVFSTSWRLAGKYVTKPSV